MPPSRLRGDGRRPRPRRRRRRARIALRGDPPRWRPVGGGCNLRAGNGASTAPTSVAAVPSRLMTTRAAEGALPGVASSAGQGTARGRGGRGRSDCRECGRRTKSGRPRGHWCELSNSSKQFLPRRSVPTGFALGPPGLSQRDQLQHHRCLLRLASTSRRFKSVQCLSLIRHLGAETPPPSGHSQSEKRPHMRTLEVGLAVRRARDVRRPVEEEVTRVLASGNRRHELRFAGLEVGLAAYKLRSGLSPYAKTYADDRGRALILVTGTLGAVLVDEHGLMCCWRHGEVVREGAVGQLTEDG